MLPNRLRKRLRRSNDRHLLVTDARNSGGLEEDMLNVALAVSREEWAKEAELRKSDEVRFQIAIEESKRCYETTFSEAYVFDIASTNPKQLPVLITNIATSDFKNGDDEIDHVLDNSGDSLTKVSNFNIFSPRFHSAPLTTQTYVQTGDANEIALRYLLQTQPTNDPWAPVPTFTEYRLLTAESNDPWNNLLTDIDDPWAAVFPEPMKTPAEFDWFLPSASQLSTNVSSGSNPTTTESCKRTAPHDNFLGPVASIVDLENLMSPTIPAIPGLRRRLRENRNPLPK